MGLPMVLGYPPGALIPPCPGWPMYTVQEREAYGYTCHDDQQDINTGVVVIARTVVHYSTGH